MEGDYTSKNIQELCDESCGFTMIGRYEAGNLKSKFVFDLDEDSKQYEKEISLDEFEGVYLMPYNCTLLEVYAYNKSYLLATHFTFNDIHDENTEYEIVITKIAPPNTYATRSLTCTSGINFSKWVNIVREFEIEHSYN